MRILLKDGKSKLRFNEFAKLVHFFIRFNIIHELRLATMLQWQWASIMVLTPYEYDELTLPDQLHLTWSVGTHLISIDTHENIFLLFAVFNYYVELVATRRYNETVITEAVAFRNGKRLDKYLEQIDLVKMLSA